MGKLIRVDFSKRGKDIVLLKRNRRKNQKEEKKFLKLYSRRTK